MGDGSACQAVAESEPPRRGRDVSGHNLRGGSLCRVVAGVSVGRTAGGILNSGIRSPFQQRESIFFWNAERAVTRMGYDVRPGCPPA